MLPFRRILFPVDFSNSCNAIVPHVREMAQHFCSELILLHASDMLSPAQDVFGDAGKASGRQCGRFEREEEALRKFAADAFPSLHPESFVVQGEPGAVICSAIHRHGVDLAMLPTRGRGPFRRLLLGSVAAKVLHDVSCAVWTTVPDALGEIRPRLPYRSIVCALSTDDEEVELMRAADGVARSFGAKLAFVHVVQLPPGRWQVDLTGYRTQIISGAHEHVRALLREEGIEAAVVIAEGGVSEQVRREALDRQADLIVVGRGHAQGRLSRAWSHLYGIVREAPCPVLSL